MRPSSASNSIVYTKGPSYRALMSFTGRILKVMNWQNRICMILLRRSWLSISGRGAGWSSWMRSRRTRGEDSKEGIEGEGGEGDGSEIIVTRIKLSWRSWSPLVLEVDSVPCFWFCSRSEVDLGWFVLSLVSAFSSSHAWQSTTIQCLICFNAISWCSWSKISFDARAWVPIAWAAVRLWCTQSLLSHDGCAAASAKSRSWTVLLDWTQKATVCLRLYEIFLFLSDLEYHDHELQNPGIGGAGLRLVCVGVTWG